MKKAYTLIEILITIIILGLVLTYVFNIYIMQKKVYYKQKPVLDMIDKSRNAMNLIVNDFQVIGNVLAYNDITTIYIGNTKLADNDNILFSFTDNNDKDDITLYYFDIDNSPQKKLEVDSVKNKVRIDMKDITPAYSDPQNDVNKIYPVIFLDTNKVGYVFYVTDIVNNPSKKIIKHKGGSQVNKKLNDNYFVSGANNKYKPSLSLPAYSYLLPKDNKFYHYYIKNNILYRNDDEVASGIESFDIRFAVKKSAAEDKVVETDSSGNIKWYSSMSEIHSSHPSYTQKDIRLVKITLVAKTLKPVVKSVSATDDNPLTSNKEQDRCKRFVIQRVIKLMNVGGF